MSHFVVAGSIFESNDRIRLAIIIIIDMQLNMIS